MALHEFRMPDPGEGLAEAEVLTWRVAVGDTVRVNQVLVEVETVKAAVELPSPYAGTVAALLVTPGDVVAVGTPIVQIDDGVTQAASPSQPPPGTEDSAGASPPDAAGSGRSAVLVGYGVRAESAPRRRPRATPHGVEHVEPGPPGAAARPVRHGGLEQARAVEARLAPASQVRAKPPVRRLARDLGVDLDRVLGTGPDGTISHADVERAAAPSPDDAERIPLTHVQRMMARAMVASAFTAPHVTEWVDVDVTATIALLAAARAHPDLAGLALTPMTVAALGLVRAARAFPRINATLDGETLLVHRRVHLGVAVDTPRGLLVPHVRNADALDLPGLAAELGRVITAARSGRARPTDLTGSTITLTNIGVFGVDGGTPLLNTDQVAILALGRVSSRAWVVDGQVVPRDVVTLALSFDHRVVDGALGSQVLGAVAAFMTDPATALALG